MVDLARNMIVLSGHMPNQDIKITYRGYAPARNSATVQEMFSSSPQNISAPGRSSAA
jgi:hypothetical protein